MRGIAVLGAAGAMAQVVLRDLAGVRSRTRGHGRRPASVRRPSIRECAPRTVDVRDEAATARLLDGHDAVLNCVTYYFNLPMMRAALAARVPYTDLGGLYHGTLEAVRAPRRVRRGGRPGAARHGLDARASPT